ncbi:phosphatidylglycerophosphatase A family protein [Flavisolibacter ginsenosidimutans]|uniref:Phosphatidylglycerophosphatase A n=1 Tax=Flavisolibacter ginsenosidimutans TaxID=661481 RepID=A0A5B8UFU4_9BACT|nr:phosphatidylglycerophosphatase A [Flavisolibacter ginsenosidimutans]QEC55454.1 phosphatidylglycerophosphatase A [Flavisolibacter ginsenosidimutans]
MIVNKLIATCLGIGYLQKGAGTVAALFCCLLWWALRIDQTSWVEQTTHILVLFFAGVWVSARVEKIWGHDSNRIVIDEWLGMSVALFLLPFSWMNYLLAFILFRFFDIAKPLFIRNAEAAPAGWGVMLDDLLAGIYSAVILHLLIKYFSF